MDCIDPWGHKESDMTEKLSLLVICPGMELLDPTAALCLVFLRASILFSIGGGNGNPFQYSLLKIPMDRGAWQATIHRDTKSWTRLSEPAILLVAMFYLPMFSPAV